MGGDLRGDNRRVRRRCCFGEKFGSGTSSDLGGNFGIGTRRDDDVHNRKDIGVVSGLSSSGRDVARATQGPAVCTRNTIAERIIHIHGILRDVKRLEIGRTDRHGGGAGQRVVDKTQGVGIGGLEIERADRCGSIVGQRVVRKTRDVSIRSGR